MTRIIITLITALLITTAQASIPMNVMLHMRQVAGLTGFTEVQCQEIFADTTGLDYPSLCFLPNQSANLSMDGIDLYVDWTRRMRPAETAQPIGVWSLSGVSDGLPLYSRLFIMESGTGYVIMIFSELVLMSYFPD